MPMNKILSPAPGELEIAVVSATARARHHTRHYAYLHALSQDEMDQLRRSVRTLSASAAATTAGRIRPHNHGSFHP